MVCFVVLRVCGAFFFPYYNFKFRDQTLGCSNDDLQNSSTKPGQFIQPQHAGCQLTELLNHCHVLMNHHGPWIKVYFKNMILPWSPIPAISYNWGSTMRRSHELNIYPIYTLAADVPEKIKPGLQKRQTMLQNQISWHTIPASQSELQEHNFLFSRLVYPLATSNCWFAESCETT